MKLCYRGAVYESAPATDNLASEQTLQPTYTLKYRGRAYTVNPAARSQAILDRPPVQLTYRGVAYGLNDALQPRAIAPRPAANRAAARAQVAAVHRENLYRNVQHRLQVAIEQGNDELIHLLEKELHQIG